MYEDILNFPTTDGFRTKISMKLVHQYVVIFFIFKTTSSHLHPLQVENCGSNSRLVVDDDDYGKFRLEREPAYWLGCDSPNVPALSRRLGTVTNAFKWALRKTVCPPTSINRLVYHFDVGILTYTVHVTTIPHWNTRAANKNKKTQSNHPYKA